MSVSDNNKKGGIMKKFIFFTCHNSYVTITVDKAGDIVKMFWFQPGTSARRLELINPKIMLDGATFDGPFLPFSEAHWNIGGNFRIAAQDIFCLSIKPRWIPTCKECGTFPVFEWRCLSHDGLREYTQGYNPKCIMCEGMEEEPLPFVSRASDIGKMMKDALDAILNFTTDEEDGGDFV
jgi:hypothetical protein